MKKLTGKLVPIFIAYMLMGCSNPSSGPESVTETSISHAHLADRIQFIENYVTFRRTYIRLDYDVNYHNNSGGFVPGPSDWDIQLLAVVPSKEVDQWIPGKAIKNEVSSSQWLQTLPGSIDKTGITEWYQQSGIEVGIDREQSIVAYRNTSMLN